MILAGLGGPPAIDTYLKIPGWGGAAQLGLGSETSVFLTLVSESSWR